MLRILLWVIAIVGVGVGAVTFVQGLVLADSAPQQAAQSAMALAFAVLPYVLARSVDQIVAIRRESHEKRRAPTLTPDTTAPKAATGPQL
jgi:hypothetical protein